MKVVLANPAESMTTSRVVTRWSEPAGQPIEVEADRGRSELRARRADGGREGDRRVAVDPLRRAVVRRPQERDLSDDRPNLVAVAGREVRCAGEDGPVVQVGDRCVEERGVPARRPSSGWRSCSSSRRHAGPGAGTCLLAPFAPNWTPRVKPWPHWITGLCAPGGVGADVVRVIDVATGAQVTVLSVLVEARFGLLTGIDRHVGGDRRDDRSGGRHPATRRRYRWCRCR